MKKFLLIMITMFIFALVSCNQAGKKPENTTVTDSTNVITNTVADTTATQTVTDTTSAGK